MSARDVRRFVEDLLNGRRTRAFRPDDEDAAAMRAAITLRAARPGGGAASEDFVANLHRRLAEELGEDEVAAARGSRRRVLQVGSVAAAAVVVGAAADRVIVGSGRPAAPDPVLTPSDGTWTRVASSVELPDGAVRPFDVGGLAGFVRRVGGQVAAVSGTCTHQGCRLRLDTQAHNLRCPCHMTAFAVTGELLEHELPQPPPPLPKLQVRETDGTIEVLGPTA